MSENQQNTGYQIKLPLVLCLGIAVGVLIGGNLKNKRAGSDVNQDMQKFREVLTQIKDEYVDTINTSALVDDAIQHMLHKLDPHSAYIPASDRIAANEDLRGNFDGIGIEFNIFNDTVVVVSALSGGPSEALGIQSGDKIVEVDGKSLAGSSITTTDVMKALKGPKGTEVKVKILRRDKELSYNIVRDKIPNYSVDVAYMVTPEIGYIKVNRFSATTYDEFQKGLARLKESGMKKLILDLQGNPGGYMNMAIEMADEFLSNGKKIVSQKGKERKYNAEASATSRGQFEKGDLIVLVNEGSASASEILAGALQDNDRALIVGRRSFGKGLVQSPFDLSDGSELRLTISRYYTPSGRSIQKPYEDGDEYAMDIVSRYNHGEGAVTETVNVSELVSSVEFNTSTMTTTVQGVMLDNLPVLARNPFTLALLNPAVVNQYWDVAHRNPFYMWSNGGLDIGGPTGGKNEQLLDGTPLNISARGSYNLPMDAVQELTVQQNAMDSEFGFSAGGTLNLSQKSGTNEYHGTVYYFGRNPALNALANRITRDANIVRTNTFGGAIGHPIIKNKLFNFFVYEKWKVTQPSSNVSTMPTDAEKNGDFSHQLTPQGSLQTIYDPFTTVFDPATSTVTRTIL